MDSYVCVKSSLLSNDVVKFVNGFSVVSFNIEPIDELKNVEL